MKNYNILNNVISKKDIDKFTHLLLDRDFPWFFEHATNRFNNFNFDDIFEHVSFEHWFVMDSVPNSKYMGQFTYIIKQLPIEHDKILRAKVNLLPKIEHKENQHNTPHVDLIDRKDIKYKACILYLNDSDGDTFLFNDKKIIKKVKPKSGKALIMDGNLVHASSHPVKNKFRIVLNIDYLSQE